MPALSMPPVLRMGFRPFFTLAMLAGILLMGGWMLMMQGVLDSPLPAASHWWHAHEMVYGYALAVAAGFLLTAVRNWTNRPTARGFALAALTLPWLAARLLPWMTFPKAWLWAGAADALFIVALSLAVLRPLADADDRVRLGIVSKIVFLLPGELLFLSGEAGLLPDGERMGVMIGLYVLVSLMLALARKLLPMFIERATGAVARPIPFWVDAGCFGGFLAFAVVETFWPESPTGAWLAAALCALHGIRLMKWRHSAIWRSPMLWSLYLAYAWVVAGLALRMLSPIAGLPSSLAVHAFAAGGIGMMTLGMMARVTLGHTGRVVMRPPSGAPLAFILMLGAATARVAGPALAPARTDAWMLSAQVLWISSLTLIALTFAPMLWKPRADGGNE